MVFSTRGRCKDAPHSFLARTKKYGIKCPALLLKNLKSHFYTLCRSVLFIYYNFAGSLLKMLKFNPIIEKKPEPEMKGESKFFPRLRLILTSLLII